MAHNPNLVNTYDRFYFRPVGLLHALYNVKLSDKYENLLKDMCWNDFYLILVMKYQYVGNWHNNITHISSVEMHVGMVDMSTLFPWPCQMLFCGYEYHEALQSFHIS